MLGIPDGAMRLSLDLALEMFAEMEAGRAFKNGPDAQVGAVDLYAATRI